MLASLVLGCAPGTTSLDLPAHAATPNVLVVSIDTLRADHVSAYGGRVDTPHLDGLLTAGIFFEDLRSCTNFTFGASACAMAGVDPIDDAFLPIGAGDPSYDEVPQDAPLLFRKLGKRGYAMALVTANSVLSRHNGYLPRGAEEVQLGYVDAAVVAEEGLAQLDELMAGDAPWALQLHFMDPHLPYELPEAYVEGEDELPRVPRWTMTGRPGIEAVVAAYEAGEVELEVLEAAMTQVAFYYAASVRYLDDQLGVLVGELEARGALDDTLVVVWSDHGEGFYEHEAVIHHTSLHGEQTLVVGSVSHPELAPRTVSGPRGLASIYDTIAEVMGWRTSARDPSIRFAHSATTDGIQHSVERDGLRLLVDVDGSAELYDLASDPTEAHDLLADRTADAAELWSLLEPRAEAACRLQPELPYAVPEL